VQEWEVDRMPEDYEAFDPEVHDQVKEVFYRWECEHWKDDLRRLRSEADAERAEARKAAEGPSPYTLAREAFVAANPRPPYDGPPEDLAEWEWREREHLYLVTDQPEALKAHRLERGAYIARMTEIHRRSRGWVDDLFEPLRETPIPGLPEPERPVWPPEDGDVVTPILGYPDDDEAEREGRRGRRRVPAYAAGEALWAGAVGWWRSLPKEAYPLAAQAYSDVVEFAHAVEGGAHGGLRAATIGERLLKIRRALPRAQEALDQLDPLLGYTWMTGPAYACLYTMIEAAREALAEHQREVQATYEGYREVALRLLGGTYEE
jgi:hypothetical protein